MSDGQTEFVIFAQVGAALGALCLLPVVIGRIIRRARGERAPRGPGFDVGPTAGVRRELVDVLAPEPSERTRVRTLEYDAIESRHASRRAEALRELRELGSEDSSTTMLVAILDPSDSVRTEAAEGIATIADPDTVEPLVHAVATRSRRAVQARDAVLSLGEVAAPELDRLARTSPDPAMRHTAAALAGALVSERGTEAVQTEHTVLA